MARSQRSPPTLLDYFTHYAAPFSGWLHSIGDLVMSPGLRYLKEWKPSSSPKKFITHLMIAFRPITLNGHVGLPHHTINPTLYTFQWDFFIQLLLDKWFYQYLLLMLWYAMYPTYVLTYHSTTLYWLLSLSTCMIVHVLLLLFSSLKIFNKLL